MKSGPLTNGMEDPATSVPKHPEFSLYKAQRDSCFKKS